MIALATPIFDLNGSLLLQHTVGSELGRLSRRVQRTATLDGGAVLTNGGFAEADRTLNVRATQVDAAEVDRFDSLLRNYPLLLLSTRVGLFLGAISSSDFDGHELKFTFLVAEKLSAATA